MKFPNSIKLLILTLFPVLLVGMDGCSCDKKNGKPKEILLSAPKILAHKDILELECINIKNGWGASFSYKEAKKITFIYYDDSVGIELEFYEALPECINKKDSKRFTKSEVIAADGKTISKFALRVGHVPISSQPTSSSEEEPPYCVSQPRNFKDTPELNMPKPISINELAELIKTRSVIFYTGAGISAQSGIWTMQPLMDALGINRTCELDQCTQDIISNPEKIIETFKQYCCNAFKAQATPAHHALASIAKIKHAQILTENFDLLHEHAGIKALHISGPWLKRNVDQEELRKIDIILCIGLSYDDRGFLGWYKSNNPDGIIVAIDLAKPSYLGNEDFLLKSDCQQALPELLSSL